ncbi:MAG: CotH kinase family protein [Bacteroidales bacterium]|nr:CotH kinase family protein [Bacteroidales bacterium]
MIKPNLLLLLLVYCLFAVPGSLFSQTFLGPVNQAIPDDGSCISFPLEVYGLPPSIDTSFGLVQVTLNMSHPYDSDMEARVLAPDGTSFLLFSGVGGDGDNFTGTVLRDDAPDYIFNYGAPFTGTFKPMGYMGTVNNGQNPNGTWKIVLHDTYPWADQGFMHNWSISFGINAPGPFTFSGTVLPIAKIMTNGNFIPNEPKVPAILHIINHPDGQPNQPSDTVYEYTGNIMVELQGFSSVGSPKKNYDIDLVNFFGLEIDTSLMGMPAENDWIFKAEPTDPTLMFNPLTYEFARKMGIYAPNTRFCELFLDGEYQGLYNLTEKVKRGENRVDIAKLKPEDTTGIELTGGYIIEMNHNGDPGAWDSEYLPINFGTSQLPVQFKYVYPKAVDIMPQQAAYIKEFVDNFELSLHQPDYADPINGYRKWIDESTFIDFMLVNEFSTNYDSYGRSTYLYKEKDTDGGKLKIGPPWDYDRGYCCVNDWVWEVTHPMWPFPDWWSIFDTDSLFIQQTYCRWYILRATEWKTEKFISYIDSVAAIIEPAAYRNLERWPTVGYYDFQAAVAILKTILTDRLAWMDNNISGADCFTSVDNLPAETAELFPNPAHHQLYLRPAQKSGNLRITLYDINGRMVLQQYTESTGLISIDISTCKPGIYAVEILDKGKVVRKKLVIE